MEHPKNMLVGARGNCIALVRSLFPFSLSAAYRTRDGGASLHIPFKNCFATRVSRMERTVLVEYSNLNGGNFN